MLSKLEVLEQECMNKNINVYYKDISLDGFCIKDNICINKNAGPVKKFWVLEHELTHLELGALYTIDSTDRQVKYRERKVIDHIIRKYNLNYYVLENLKLGWDKWEICEGLEIPYELFDDVIDYLQRKGELPKCLIEV